MSGTAWPMVPLSEACSLITDGTHHSPPNGPTGDFRYVTAKNVKRRGLDLSDITYVAADVHREIYARCPAEQGDVLYIKDGATTGIAAINHLAEPISLLSSVALLKPRREILEPRFLAHWLNSPDTFARMIGGMTGSAMRRLILRHIRAVEIPLPPRDEQKRIADKLDALLARVDACRERIDDIPATLRRFRQSVLTRATAGALTADWRGGRRGEQRWETVPIGDLCEESFYGPRFGKDEYTSTASGVPTIRTTDMTEDGRIAISESTPRVAVSPGRIEGFRVRRGDLLVTRTGSIGVMAVFDSDYLAIPSAYLIRFRFFPRVLPRYVFLSLMSPSGQRRLGLSSTAVTQPNVNAEAVKRIVIGLPSLEEQEEIVRRVDEILAIGDRIQARCGGASDRVEQLTAAIFARAFRGELLSHGTGKIEGQRGAELPSGNPS